MKFADVTGLRSSGPHRLLVVVALAVIMAIAGMVPVSAQEPPPSIHLTTLASLGFADSPRQYDLMQALVELAPGAAVPSHRVNGRAIITVLSGAVTRIEDDGHESVFRAGETFPEISEDEFDVDINRGIVPARFLATFLLQPGAEPLIFNPNAAPSTAPGPTFVAVARTTVGTIPARFTLAHGLFDVPPGFAVGPHAHDDWSIVTELSGGHVTNRVNGVVQTGATFVHGPHDVHDAAYTGRDVVRAMFASVGPTGAPPYLPPTTRVTQTQAIQPPSTGDGGLAPSR